MDQSDYKDGSRDDSVEQQPWYEVLHLSADATKSQIKTAYREQIMQYHPDRVSGLGEKLQVLAKTETQKLNAARDEGLRRH